MRMVSILGKYGCALRPVQDDQAGLPHAFAQSIYRRTGLDHLVARGAMGSIPSIWLA